MKTYDTPTMQVVSLGNMDIITLSIGSDNYDPEINSNQGQNPWAK